MQVDGLTKSFGDLVLFRKISFGVAEGQRIGLIAKNGTGKTTLLNIIAGKEGYDEGSIVFRRDLRVGYLEQDPHYPEDLTVLEACFYHGNSTVELIKEYESCMETEGNPGLEELLARMEHEKAWDYERKAKQILSQLKIRDFSQQIKHLSGGQLKRVALANVLITEPDFLILDEPTNHLDLDMTEWLEGYLGRGNISLLMVTHDRYFLDRVCSEIIEIDNQQVYSYKGNYSYYLEKRQERIEATNAEIARANNLYRTELEWMRRMPQARGHKARYREEAFYELDVIVRHQILAGKHGRQNTFQLPQGGTYKQPTVAFNPFLVRQRIQFLSGAGSKSLFHHPGRVTASGIFLFGISTLLETFPMIGGSVRKHLEAKKSLFYGT